MSDKFKLVGYTGQVIEGGWWGRLAIDLTGIRTTTPMPALREHNASRPVGVIERTGTEDGKLVAYGRFLGSSADGRAVRELIEEGFPYQASVGCFPEQVEEVKAGSTAKVNGYSLSGPAVVVRKSHVREISFVSLGADAGTSAKIAASALHPATGGQAPKDFAEALQLKLREGLPTGQAIKAAREKWPWLYQAYVKSFAEVD